MNMDVIKRALKWANDQGMNQSELAARIGVLPQHITNWKTRGMPSDQYQIVADALGKTVDELLGRTSETKEGYRAGPEIWSAPSVDARKVRALSAADRAKLEAAILIAAAQAGLDIKKDS